MAAWKNSKTTEQVAEEMLRDYLIRCHRIISDDYPEIANMDPSNGADFLLHLRETDRIEIKLYDKSPTSIGCKIIELDRDRDDEE